MKIWLTLDGCFTYLIDGVAGCAVWVSQPWLHESGQWTSETVERGSLRIGKAIFNHSEVDRIDTEAMKHFVPDVDLTLDRRCRFEIVKEAKFNGSTVGDRSFITTLEVTPIEWFGWAMDVGRSNSYEAESAQRVYDAALPF